MLDELFAEAWINSTHRVLGLRLHPFSLWHRFQLAVIDSPVLAGTKVEPIDLERACRVCQLVYPEVISPRIKWWSFRWRLAGRDFQTEIQKLGAYFDDHWSIPKFVPPIRKKGDMPESINHPPPEEIRIISAVLTMTGWSEEKVWNMPIGQAYWYAAGHWYQTGMELDFLTPEHLVLQQRINEMKKAKQDASA